MKNKLLTFLALSLACPFVLAEPKVEEVCCEGEAVLGPEGHRLEADPAAQGSLFDFDHSWTDQFAKPFRLASLAGKPIILAMGYTSCQFACPRLMADLMAIERELSEAEKAQTHFLFVTIDPENDTPEAFIKFLESYQVDPARWHGLQGDAESTRELSVALGVRFKGITGGDFAHSNLIILLGPDGSIRHRQQGLGGKPKELVEALRAAFPATKP